MIKRRSLTLFVLAIGLGIAATWMANQWIKSRLTPVAQTKPEVAAVVVAALEIPFGQKIEAAQLKTMEWPSGTVPPGAFTDPSKVEGKIANGKIFPNEVILGDRVVDQVSGSTLAAVIAPKKRAVTVRVNDVIGVAGFLLPGNRVDVIAARKSNGSSRRSITRTILQDLKVLAVDQTAAPEKDKPVVVRAVTLEMDPKQAEVLIKATDEGSVQLSLRNPKDDSQLMAAKKPGGPEKKVVHVAPAKSYARHVTVIRGTRIDKTRVRL